MSIETEFATALYVFQSLCASATAEELQAKIELLKQAVEKKTTLREIDKTVAKAILDFGEQRIKEERGWK